MARIIRFPLIMTNGTEVRTLEELREHFDLNAVLGYYSNGKLLSWLQARYYDIEAEKLSQLSSEMNDFKEKLCEILGVSCDDTEDTDYGHIQHRNEKIRELIALDCNEVLINNADQVALTQDDLIDCLNRGFDRIYLVEKIFTIPLTVSNVTFVGEKNAGAIIRAADNVCFMEKNIKFENMSFAWDTSAVTPDDKIRQAEDVLLNGDLGKAMDMLHETEYMGNPRTYILLWMIYQLCIGDSEKANEYSDLLGKTGHIVSLKQNIEPLKIVSDNGNLIDRFFYYIATQNAVELEKLADERYPFIHSALAFMHDLDKKTDDFLSRYADSEFLITLVGDNKTGKSTLINALLGYEYASTEFRCVTVPNKNSPLTKNTSETFNFLKRTHETASHTEVVPETTSFTKFKKSNANYVKIAYYKSSEWDELWKSAVDSHAEVFLEEYANHNADSQKEQWLDKEDTTIICSSKENLAAEIQKWTSSKSVCHYFVKEVTVGLKDFDLPEGVVLVDTPGLDDDVKYRSNITRDYIDRANAIFTCVKAGALNNQDKSMIQSVFANTRSNHGKVYIIATQIDIVNDPCSDWRRKGENAWLKYREDERVYGRLIANWKFWQKEWLKYFEGAHDFRYISQKNLIPVSSSNIDELKMKIDSEIVAAHKKQ